MEIQEFDSKTPLVDTVIGSCDGVIVPIVIPGKEGYKRKNKEHLFYKEMKTSLAYKKGEI